MRTPATEPTAFEESFDGHGRQLPVDERQVLVVGAGIGGLALAGFLLARGIRPVVLERTASGEGRDHGLVLDADARSALAPLSLSEAVRDAGRDLRAWTHQTPEGSVTEERNEDAPGEPASIVSRRALRALLAQRVPADVVRSETALVRLDRCRESVEVEFDDGVREQFDVVVGADGVHSRVREAVRDDPAATPLGTTSYVCSLPGDGRGADEVTLRRASPGTFAAIHPTDDGRLCHLATTDRGDAAMNGDGGGDPAASLASLAAEVDWLPSAERLRSSTDRVWRRQDYRVPAGAWRRGRVALVGDAAHATHPFAGAGVALALGDAAALAAALDDHRDDVPTALEAYVDRRRAAVRRSRRRGGDAGESRQATGRDELARAWALRRRRLARALDDAQSA